MSTAVELIVTDEQEMLRSTLRRLLDDHAPLARLRQVADGSVGADPDLWARLVELGLPGLAIPESYGGLGQGASDVALVAEELGRALCLAPLFSTLALTGPALLASEDQAACADLLPGLASGETVAALAVSAEDGRWAPAVPPVRAERSDADRWTLTGRACFVVDGLAADLLLVLAATDEGSSLFAVDPSAGGVERQAMDVLDPSRALAEVALSDTPGRLIGTLGAGEAIMAAVTDSVALVVAAEAVGGMRACLDRSVAYASERTQFGVPIGSFQAVAHTCVDMLRRVEFGASAVQYAAAARDQGSPEADLATRVAAAYCGEGYHWVTKETIQVHGGLGFTWDHDAHLFYRRARSSEQLFAARTDHVEAVTRLVGL